ncbi:unnamed protein product [Meloidogyne enterolobii]|uniref:Uncharacterized protein n=1 Tax=Meloidogyne enterolobii TaxID=390850 RepID=A0ACB0ZVF0_MELEN
MTFYTRGVGDTTGEADMAKMCEKYCFDFFKIIYLSFSIFLLLTVSSSQFLHFHSFY